MRLPLKTLVPLRVRTLVRAIVPPGARERLRHWAEPANRAPSEISDGYEILALEEARRSPSPAWRDEEVARTQYRAFMPILDELYSGRPRADFATLAQAVRLTGLADPLIFEIGCASAWNSDVLKQLLGREIRYIGLDCNRAMLEIGARTYHVPLVVGDALALPFADAACDIAVSGGILLHLVEYERAIAETRRVARRFAIFHVVPIVHDRATTILRKRAYGKQTLEVVFNEAHLLEMFQRAGLSLRHVLETLPYDLVDAVGEHTETRTYVCEVSR